MNIRIVAAGLAVVISAFAGFAAGGYLSPRMPDASPGDWLQFGGVALGLTVTVGMTVLIEHVNRTSKQRGDDRRYREVVALLRRALTAAIDDFPTGNSKEDKNIALEIEARLVDAIKKYRFVREQITVVTLDRWEETTAIDNAIKTHEPVLSRELVILSQDADSDAVFSINRAKVKEAALMLRLGMVARNAPPFP